MGKFTDLATQPIVTSRIQIALSQADLDSVDPNRGAVGTVESETDFVGSLITENFDLWDQLVHHPFVDRISTVNLPFNGFRNFKLQDKLLFKKFVDFKQLHAGKNVNDWSPADKAFADSQYKYLKEQLGIDDQPIAQSTIVSATEDAAGLLSTTLLHKHWIALHVALLPCVFAYSEIAAKLHKESKAAPYSCYWSFIIQPHEAAGYLSEYRKFVNGGLAPFQGSEDKAEWKNLFRLGCLKEIGLFDICFQTPQPQFITITPKVHVIRNSLTSLVVDLDLGHVNEEGARIIGWSYWGGENQKWTLEVDNEGLYSFKNLKSGTYISHSERKSDGTFIIANHSKPAKFYILPSTYAGVPGAYVIMLAKEQCLILDNLDGNPANDALLGAYWDYVGTDNNKGKSAAWLLQE